MAVATAQSDPRGFITEIREISAEEEKLKQQIAELNALLAQPQNASNLALKTELVETETELAKLQSQMQQLQPTWSQTWAQMTASAQNDILQISSAFSNAYGQWITTGKSFGLELEKQFTQILVSFEKMVIEIITSGHC